MKIWPGVVFAISLLQGCAFIQPQPVPGEQPQAHPGADQKTEPQFAFTLLEPPNIEEQISKWTMQQAGREALRLQRSEVGYYVDVQEAQLQQRLRDGHAALLRQDDTILLRITDAFETNSSRLNPVVEMELGSISEVLLEFGKTLVIVNSHTDMSGSPDYNRRLSEQRAIAVARYLVANGVPADRIAAAGHGESSPLRHSGTAQSEWPNRRIEIRLALIIDEAS